MKKLVATLAVLALLAVPALAYGDDSDSGRSLVRSGMVGSTPGVVIAGIPAGGAPWTIDERTVARVRADGRITINVRGLLLTNTGDPALDGTTGGIPAVFASLTCAGATPTVIDTASVPLSADGDARIRDTVSLPDTCFAAAVLVRGDRAGDGPTEGAAPDPWFAVTGF